MILTFSDIESVRQIIGTIQEKKNVCEIIFKRADSTEAGKIISAADKLAEPTELVEDEIMVGIYGHYDVLDIQSIGFIVCKV
jgi:hypothetical protein